MLIIGLTGTHGSGKGEVGKYLVNKGFKYYSCSDELREEAKKLNLPETRENLGIVIGDKLRKEFGKGVLGKRVFCKILKLFWYVYIITHRLEWFKHIITYRLYWFKHIVGIEVFQN